MGLGGSLNWACGSLGPFLLAQTPSLDIPGTQKSCSQGRLADPPGSLLLCVKDIIKVLLPCLSPEMGGGRDSAPGPFVTLVRGRWSVRRCEARAGRAESHRESDTTGPASPVKLRIHAVQGELGTSQLVTLNEEKQVKYLYFKYHLSLRKAQTVPLEWKPVYWSLGYCYLVLLQVLVCFSSFCSNGY